MNRAPANQLGVGVLPDGTDVNGWSVSADPTPKCSTDTTPYNELNEGLDANNGDTTCREGNTNGNRVGVTLQNPVWTDPSDVDDFNVTSSAVVRKTGTSSASSFSLDAKVGTSAYNDGVAQSVTTSYVRYSRVDNVNPLTGVEWTSTDINNLIIAARCTDCSPDERVTQMQAKIDAKYNPEFALEVRFAWTGVPTAGNPLALAVECQRLNPGAENVLVQVGQGGNPPAKWKTAYTCTSDVDQSFTTYTLSTAELNGGAPLVRLWDAQAHPPDDTLQGTMAVDVLRIDRAGSPSGPTSPPPSQPVKTAYTPPYSNLRVRSLRLDRPVAGSGRQVNFTVEAENVGFQLTPLVNLTLYNNVVSNSTAIAWTRLDMWNFNATVDLSWITSGLGTHTIIAFVDANNSYVERNESDNKASVVLLVQSGSGPGVPDIEADEGGIGLASQPQAGQTTTLSVRIRNVGDSSALGFTVRVRDNGAPLDYYTIAVLSASSSDVHVISWNPATEGPHFINVTADEGGTNLELREDNNFASMGIYVTQYPIPACWYSLGEYTVPAGAEVVYDHCTVLANNVTVYGKLRLLNGSTLVVGRWYLLQIWPWPYPRPFPLHPLHSLRIEAGGLLELKNSRLTASSATYAFGFEAKSGSAFYFNVSTAYYPWGPWPLLLLAGGNGTGEIPGGLIVRTSTFTFQSSTVAFGRLHGLFLDSVVLAPPYVTTNIFRDNHGAGLVGMNATLMTVSSSQFLRNSVGMYQRGRPPTTTSQALVQSSTFRWNVVGVESHKRSYVNITGSDLFRDNSLAGVRLVWETGSPYRTDPIASSTFAENRFGIYAYRASPSVETSAFCTLSATCSGTISMIHVALDASPYVSQSGKEWPRVASNAFSSWPYSRPPLVEVGVSAYFTTVSIKSNVMAVYQGVSCITATCRVDNNQLGGIFNGTAAMVASSLTMRNNTVTHVGGQTWDVLADNSTALVRDNTFSGGTLWSINVVLGAAPQIINNTIDGLVQLFRSDNGLVNGNRVTPGSCGSYCVVNVIVVNSANAKVTGNTISTLLGIELDTSPNAVIEKNTIQSPIYYSPQSPPTQNQAESQALIKVYTNSTATIRNNVLRNGAWGISLDDNRAGPLTLPLRSTYALVQNNVIETNGFVAVGVNSSTRGDVLNNWVNWSSGWGLFMESSFSGNRIENNSLRTCHGINPDSYGGCIRVSREGPSGAVVVANNTISLGNTTGIYVRDDYNVLIRDNTVSNVTGKTIKEYGECITMVSTIPVTVVHNTLRDCRIGIWVQRGTGHDLTRNTVTNTTVVNVTWGLRLDDTGGAITWANVHDNNTFSGWTYGVWINANFVDPNAGKFRLWWGDVKSNKEGLHVVGNPTQTWGSGKYYQGKCNWWNSASGPDDPNPGNPDTNPNPGQQFVTDYFWYRDPLPPPPPQAQLWWLKGASSGAVSCAP